MKKLMKSAKLLFFTEASPPGELASLRGALKIKVSDFPFD
jgi:hypothetical protein